MVAACKDRNVAGLVQERRICNSVILSEARRAGLDSFCTRLPRILSESNREA